jgi:hypothetical protein
MKLSRKDSHTKLLTHALALGLMFFMTGCASVDPEPFSMFANSLQPLRDAVDVQAEAVMTESRKELIQKVADENDPMIAPDLQLDFPAPGHFASRYEFGQNGEPNFVKFRRMQLGLSALNDAMISYARSLEMLGGGAGTGDILPSTTEFSQMARNLNASAGTAAAALNISTDPGKQALLSTAAIQLFKTYIENKRRKDLVKAIGEVQPQVDAYSESARQAVGLFAEVVKKEYSKKIIPLSEAQPPNALAILDFNDATQSTLAILKSMANSYGALPAAHRDLKAAANNKSAGLSGIIALGEEAMRLNGLVNQLTEVNVAAAAATAAQ